ncbi:MAG: sodium-dependent bicarbonate transport family permease [Crocinitomicaceae bacterium]|jgi:hypothetical protein|nr:sodium-dependent bicarbonate transport family permease [Crocinitomicaceae bacterium]MCF8411384.1 sodium-dependent bicarbonate transport family permease [Crocinitomicaceae bacterium]MCF8445279.1 sodium-dependent bicarbonate transport family permease [Crocinitomicaceae bacterium]
MNIEILVSNLTNPTLLFFVLGMFAAYVKSDLEVPESSFKFISLYLLFSIGFKGGQELVHTEFSNEVYFALLSGLILASIIPLYTFYILKTKLDTANAGAIAAAYGSVSAVTFIAATSFLEYQNIPFGGHMVAVMALMEFPAIIVGVYLINRFNTEENNPMSMKSTLRHSLTNGSVLMIFGSLLIGYISNDKQAMDIKPFTTDIFKGFLALFLLEMGITTAKRFSAFRNNGLFVLFFAILIPLINGTLVAFVSQFFLTSEGNRFILSILAASASYIAVPAAMRLVAPKADPGLYIPMALGVTFPMNITLGMPIYFEIIYLTQ